MPRSLLRYFIVVVATASILSTFQPLSAQNRVDNDAVLGEFLLLLLGSEEGKRQALAFVDTIHREDVSTPVYFR